MPISRHFEIIYLLLQKKTLTAAEFAEHFEVSTRTIYRDIDTLSAAGIPIYSSRGKGGGISLLDRYVFNTSLLSESEQNDILMALQSLSAIKLPDTSDVLDKLSRLFKKDMNNWIEVDFSKWGSGDQQRELFPLLRQAIIAHQLIEFRYYNSAGEQSQRSVEPLRLLFKDKSWYLEGHCRNSDSSRVFKISRMKEIVVTEIVCDPRPVVTFADAEENVMRNAIEVTLRIAAQGAYRIFDEFAEHTITRNEDGSYSITEYFSEGNWLDSYLLSFGVLLEEVKPEHLRTRILAQIDTIRTKLGGN